MLFEDERRDLLELKPCGAGTPARYCFGAEEAGKSARSTQPLHTTFSFQLHGSSPSVTSALGLLPL